MQKAFWSFLTHSDCITQIPVLIPLINAFRFEGKEREYCGSQRSKEKTKALGKAWGSGDGGMRVRVRGEFPGMRATEYEELGQGRGKGAGR